MVFIINPAFTPISVNVCQFVDGKSVLFVEGSTVEGFRSCDRLLWGFEFNEGISVSVSLSGESVEMPFDTLESSPGRLKACM